MQVDWGACSTANDAEQRLERQCKRLSRPNSDWKLHLSHAQLDYIPSKVLSSNFASLLRLDLSFNRIKEIPSGIGLLLSLTELWIAHNPLETISPAIKGCLNLESLNISFTRVAEVPSEISFLKNLRTFDWRGTPFAENMSSLLSSSSSLLLPSKASTVFGLKEFKFTVGEVYKREELIRDLKGKLSVGHYAQDIVLIDYDNLVEELIQSISRALPNVADFGLFCRLHSRLLPDRLGKAQNALHITEKVVKKLRLLQEDFSRQRLSADVDIKIRCFYYDRIERVKATEITEDIYKHVATLQDMQFFVRHASELHPPDPKDCSGEFIWTEILRLQTHLSSLREASIASLSSALALQYPEQPPDVIRDLAENLSRAYQGGDRFPGKREIERMTFLTAEVSRLFPPDVGAIDIPAIIAAATDLSNTNTSMHLKRK